jgi:hypothetical protein
VDVGVAAGYEYGSAADGTSAVAQSAANAANRATLLTSNTLAEVNILLPSDAVAASSTTDDPQIFKVGASLGVSGFSVAGSYAWNEVDTSQEGVAWDLGVSYSTGPWGVSGTWFHGEQEGAAGGSDDEVDAILGAVSYSIGPGITASGQLLYASWDNGADGGDDSESVVGIVGLSISF